MKRVMCPPPCGSEFKVHDDNELVEIVQRHAKAKHNKNISREEIMKMAREA